MGRAAQRFPARDRSYSSGATKREMLRNGDNNLHSAQLSEQENQLASDAAPPQGVNSLQEWKGSIQLGPGTPVGSNTTINVDLADGTSWGHHEEATVNSWLFLSPGVGISYAEDNNDPLVNTSVNLFSTATTTTPGTSDMQILLIGACLFGFAGGSRPRKANIA